MNGLIWASLDADRVLTVVTRNGQDMNSDIGEVPFLPLVHTHPFFGAGGKIMPLFAGNNACITANAATQVEEEPILNHHGAPLYFSI